MSGEKANIVLLDDLCRALGVKNVQIVDAFDTKKLENVIKEEVARDEVSVIIAQSPCALLKSYVPKGKCVEFLKNVKNADFVLLQDVLQLQRMKMELFQLTRHYVMVVDFVCRIVISMQLN